MMEGKKISPAFKVFKRMLTACYLKIKVEGLENLPAEPCIIAANHAQVHGPLAFELCFPGKHYTWCAGQMMKLNEVPAYAFQDFWSGKPVYIRWLYKLLSYIIAPLAVFVFGNANTISVYHDSRIMTTFRNSLAALQENANVIIFPEEYQPHNNIVYNFQQGFVDVARLYHRKTGKEISFVPAYVAPKLKKLYLGTPVTFCASAPIDKERKRICSYLMDEITKIATALPEHTVIPYPNIPKKLYPSNLSRGEKNEKTGR